MHLAVHEESLRFPKFELYELGSQIRRSSNAAPAILAEGCGSRHTNIYLEAIDRSKGEVRETQHHLDMAHAKKYVDSGRWTELDAAYVIAYKMMARLYERLSEWRDTTRTGSVVRENPCSYSTGVPNCGDDALMAITLEVDAEFFPSPTTHHLPPTTSRLPP